MKSSLAFGLLWNPAVVVVVDTRLKEQLCGDDGRFQSRGDGFQMAWTEVNDPLLFSLAGLIG
jgi:hypothetical protein